MENTFSVGLKNNIAPQQEYLLQGSIVDLHREVLIHRLRGLCDNADKQPETFSDHEMVFVLRGATAQQNPVLFRVRRSLDPPDDPSWHIRYLGTSEIGDKNRHTLVRACFDVACSNNVVKFLNEMGFRSDHEYCVKGYFFHKGRMKVTVSKIYRMVQTGAPDGNTQEAMTQSSLVELSVVAPAGQEQIADDMKNFAEQLKPLVQLEKVDQKRLSVQ
ncbi:mediator of RNA polymerase II transcription subunit 18 [Patella vulgata]|uniref:mediator of RNA polymerase II transcription subunit 18 n=1 Tax=Patella vulgata TaxID=6465 RepID=UPI0021800020|nr:mediator of RNA polymerase II transcription subunit 18 [Patella vulgata]